jgi:predicted nuclease with TOPRIM domain
MKEETTEEGRSMREQVQVRLEELKKELEAGQAELQKVEMQRAYLHETVLRIGGAVQVLEELLTEGPHAKADEAVGPGGDQLATSPSKEATG